jgi:hypothetical protein
MAQNFVDERENNVQLHETRFHMLWNATLNLHFPFNLGYGSAPQTSITGAGTKQDFFVVKIIRESEDVVVVAGLNSSFDETKAEMDTLQAELAEFIKERFSQTQYLTIYGIGGVGLSWTALKVDKTDFDRPMIIVPRRGNVTSNESFSLLKAVADEIYAMAS